MEGQSRTGHHRATIPGVAIVAWDGGRRFGQRSPTVSGVPGERDENPS
jgi:hypothetical protein